MQFIRKPKPLLPFMNRKECSLRLCSNFCPEWCDGIFSPPGPPPPPAPPFSFPEDKSESGPTFSPLVIAIIGILASAFLLVSYYAVITKYCNSSARRSREVEGAQNDDLFDEDDDDDDGNNIQQHHNHEAWLINTPGLDEALIKKISLVKFKKGDGLISTSDCSVCLGEFSEDDALRLLPKCGHAFHVACIDTWLRSHLNCPLCRANVISTNNSQPPSTPPNNNHPHLLFDSVFNNTGNNSSNHNNVIQDHSTGLENQAANEGVRSNVEERQIMEGNGILAKTQFRAMSDLGYRGDRGRETVRRSISMDHRYETWFSIPDVHRCSHGEDCIVKICQLDEQSHKRVAGEISKISHSSSSTRNGALHSVKNGVVMKRSFSSGRFLFNKHARGKNTVLPL